MLPTVARRESAPRKAQTEAEARLAAAGDAAAAAAEGLRARAESAEDARRVRMINFSSLQACFSSRSQSNKVD